MDRLCVSCMRKVTDKPYVYKLNSTVTAQLSSSLILSIKSSSLKLFTIIFLKKSRTIIFHKRSSSQLNSGA